MTTKTKLDYENVVKNIRIKLKNYIIDNSLKSLVLGVSGGVDSALTAVLANEVCNELNIPLIGRSIKIESNKPEEIERAKNVGDRFCTDFKEIDLTNEYNILKNSFFEENTNNSSNEISKLRKGNFKARIRMIYLYDLAQKNSGMVLSTDNYTELLCGFWTLHGDVGDYGMIQNLWKTEVYEMSKYLSEILENSNSLKECINAIPTDGLGISNSDLEQLGVSSYDEADNILMKYLGILEYENDKELIENHIIVKRYINTEFKRNNPLNLTREEIID